jgi:P4 family phage/plasmid primase-like protien
MNQITTPTARQQASMVIELSKVIKGDQKPDVILPEYLKNDLQKRILAIAVDLDKSGQIVNGINVLRAIERIPEANGLLIEFTKLDYMSENVDREIEKANRQSNPLRWSDSTELHKIFLEKKYPNDGYFVFDGKAYTWNGQFWNDRGIGEIIEEFYQWAMNGETEFKQTIDSLIRERLLKKDTKYQRIFDQSVKNLQIYRGSRELKNQNPFASIDYVSPYWTFPNGALLIKNSGVTWFPRNQNSEDFFMSLYPMGCMGFNYDSQAVDAPLFNATIARLIPEGADHMEGMQFILECFAYSLLPEKTVPYYFICHGLEGSGKSSLAEILKELSGHYFISKAMKEVFSEFGKAALVGKLIVYDDDISDDYTIPAEIKKLSGDSIVSINEKREKQYQARLNIAPWMIGNKPPKNTGSGGHRRRAIVLNFNSTADRDPFHMKKMFGRIDGYQDERAAIMNMVLQVLPDFINRGYEFSRPQWAIEHHQQWISSGNAVASYFSEMFKREEIKNWYKQGAVYQHFKSWCEATGHYVKSNQSFYASLDGEKIKRRRHKTNGWEILCHFDIPKMTNEIATTLRLNYSEPEESSDDQDDGPPF